MAYQINSLLEAVVKCPRGSHPISLWECASIPNRTETLSGTCAAHNAIFDDQLKRCRILNRTPARLQCTHGYLIGHSDKKICKNHSRVPPEKYCDPPYALVDSMCEKKQVGPAEIGCMPGESKEGFKCIRADHVPMILKCPAGFTPHDTKAKEGTCEKKHSWKGQWFGNAPHCPEQPGINDQPRYTNITVDYLAVSFSSNVTQKPTIPPPTPMINGIDNSGKLHPHIWVETIFQTEQESDDRFPEVVCSQYEYVRGVYVCDHADAVPFEEWVKPVSQGGRGNWPILQFKPNIDGDPKFTCVIPRAYPWRPVCPNFRGRAFVRPLISQKEIFWMERPPGLIWAAGNDWINIFERQSRGETILDLPRGSEWNLNKTSDVHGRPQDGDDEKHNLGAQAAAFLNEVESENGPLGASSPILSPSIGSQDLANSIRTPRQLQYEWQDYSPQTKGRRLGIAYNENLESGFIRKGSSLSGSAWMRLNRDIWFGEPQKTESDQVDNEEPIDDYPLWRDHAQPTVFQRMLEGWLEGPDSPAHHHIQAQNAFSQDLLQNMLNSAFTDNSEDVTVINKTYAGREFEVMRLPLAGLAERFAQRVKDLAPNRNNNGTRKMALDAPTRARPGPTRDLPDAENPGLASQYVNQLIQDMWLELNGSQMALDDVGVESWIRWMSPKPRSVDVASRFWISWVYEGLMLPICSEYELRTPRRRCPESFKMGADATCKPTDFASPFVICPPEYVFEPESVVRFKELEDPKTMKQEQKRSSGGDDLVIRTKNLPKCIGFEDTYTEFHCDDPKCIPDLENRVCVCDMMFRPAAKSPSREELKKLWGLKGTELYDSVKSYVERAPGRNSTSLQSILSGQATSTPNGEKTDEPITNVTEYHAAPQKWYPFASTLLPLHVFRAVFREMFPDVVKSNIFKISEFKHAREYGIFRAVFDPRDYIHWVRRKRDFQSEYMVAIAADRLLVISNRPDVTQQLLLNRGEPSEYNWGNNASARLASFPLNPVPVVAKTPIINIHRNDSFDQRFGPPSSLAASGDPSSLALGLQPSGLFNSSSREQRIIDLFARPNLNRHKQSIRAPLVLDEEGNHHAAIMPEDYW